MDYPKQIKIRQKVDKKLGIKSSLRDLKPLFALTYILWNVSDKVPEIEYSNEKQNNSKKEIQIKEKIYDKLKDLFSDLIINQTEVNETIFHGAINKNPLFTSQFESLIVALELYWKLAKITFIDEYPGSKERTERDRYNKKLLY